MANAILSTFDFEHNDSQEKVTPVALAADMLDIKAKLAALTDMLSAGK